MNPAKFIKEDIKRIKEISLRGLTVSVIAAVCMSLFALTGSPTCVMTLSPLNWGAVFVIPFAAQFLFCLLTHKKERSVFGFAKWCYFIAVDLLLMLVSEGIFGYGFDLDGTGRFYSRFLPIWALIWFLGIIAAYLIMRIAGKAVEKGLEKDSFTARFIYAVTAMYTPQKTLSKTKRQGGRKWVAAVICMVLVAVAVFLFTVTMFLHFVYSNMEFEAILFTITFAAGGLAMEDLIQGFTLTVLFAVITGYFCFNMYKCFMNDEIVVADSGRSDRYTLTMNSRKRAVIISVTGILLLGSAAMFSWQTHFVHYIDMKTGRSTVYDSYYVKPTAENVVFPEKKRNLVFIYLESIENTYASKDAGGSQDKNYIAELTALAGEDDCVNFSNTDRLGGASVFVPAISYTQGSTVAQTSGIALNTQFSQFYKDPEYPEMVRLEDILHDNGYEQLYIEGSKGEFSLYDKYVGRYENSRVFDRKTAAEEGYSDENADYIWKWGIEDSKLVEITKQLITEMSKKDKPFFVTMYTMDTHTFESGHRCKDCDSSIKNDYLASVDCTSRRIAGFVEWIRQQPFFENTTVILVGDHLGNEKTTKVEISDDYTRTTYNCIINPAKKPAENKNRIFSSLDMFPTALSAIGAEIKGDRLGLGTDLFSRTKTLCEELGEEEYKLQLEKTSEYYKKEFFGEKPAE